MKSWNYIKVEGCDKCDYAGYTDSICSHCGGSGCGVCQGHGTVPVACPCNEHPYEEEVA